MEIRAVFVFFVSAHLVAMEFRKTQAAGDTPDEGEIQTKCRGSTAPDKHPAYTSLCAPGFMRLLSTSEASHGGALSTRSSKASNRPDSFSSSGVSSQDAPDSSSPRSSTSSTTPSTSFNISASYGMRGSSSYTSLSDLEDEFSLNKDNLLLPHSSADLCDGACLLSSSVPKHPAQTVFRSGSSLSSNVNCPPLSSEDTWPRSSFENTVAAEDFSPLPPSTSPVSYDGTQPSRSTLLGASSGAVCSYGHMAPGSSESSTASPTRTRHSPDDLAQGSRRGTGYAKNSCTQKNYLHPPSCGDFTSSRVREPHCCFSGADSTKVSAAGQEKPACNSGFGSSASSPLRCERGEDMHLPQSSWPLPSSERPLPAGVSSEKADGQGSVAGKSRLITPFSPTLSCKKTTFGSSAPPEEKATRNFGPLYGKSLTSLTTSGDRVDQVGNGEDLSARKSSGISPVSGHVDSVEKPPRVLLQKTLDLHGSATLENSKKSNTLGAFFLKGSFMSDLNKKQDKSAEGTQLKRKNHPRRSSSFQIPRSFKSLTFGRSPGPSTSSSSTASSASPSSAKATASSGIRRSQSMTITAKEALPEEAGSIWKSSSFLRVITRKVASSARPSRSKILSSGSLVAGASEALSSDNVTEAQAAQQRATEEYAAREEARWKKLRGYAYRCTDTSVQKSLEVLTDEVRDLVDTMKTDARRLGPCFQDPEICQKERPQMVCPQLLRYVGSQNLVDLAKKAHRSLPLNAPGEQEAFILESIAPKGQEIRFTSLVWGKTFTLKQEAFFVVTPPVHLMVMRDEKGRLFFLEILIVDCSRINEELLIHSETLRLQALKKLRLQSSLKVNAITPALGLSSINDVWMIDPEGNTNEQDEGGCLYSVAPFLKVKEPWLTDLETLVMLLREEALEPQNQTRVYQMRLNLTVQVLAVVGSLDSHGVLPRRFTTRDFALSPQGTIICLLSPVFQSPPKRTLLLTKAVVPHHSRLSLVGLLVAIWCSSELDYELLGTVSDWHTEEYLYFPNCVPTTPPEVKNLIVKLCSPATVNLYTFFDKYDFKHLADNVRVTVQGLKKPPKGDKGLRRGLKKPQRSAAHATSDGVPAHRRHLPKQTPLGSRDLRRQHLEKLSSK